MTDTQWARIEPLLPVQRDFTANVPNRLRATDLTVIATEEGPLWLSAIRDASSRRVVARETSARADADLVLTTLEYETETSEGDDSTTYPVEQLWPPCPIPASGRAAPTLAFVLALAECAVLVRSELDAPFANDVCVP
ncbi:hypothetical protein OG978_44490 (plasmid) [Streptomyces sp. NBC_01591]|uniref:hypothetical protein n=1 Tax=Streptomyces sp. NBC_01591 TaxID=2975888 RepID=UPI002DD924FC|nr:hypothetical protein [Streptomyces sp. NBC_01591]WSD74180.1 hypothetical protein OG978_44490 [Streptomyces sp. NBC_01591]